MKTKAKMVIGNGGILTVIFSLHLFSLALRYSLDFPTHE